jgi:hypothetical protein
VAPSLLLVALLVLPWLLTARSKAAAWAPRTPAWITPPPRQSMQPWADPDDWWREASALPSRLPRPPACRAAAPAEV